MLGMFDFLSKVVGLKQKHQKKNRVRVKAVSSRISVDEWTRLGYTPMASKHSLEDGKGWLFDCDGYVVAKISCPIPNHEIGLK